MDVWLHGLRIKYKKIKRAERVCVQDTKRWGEVAKAGVMRKCV